MWKLLEKIRSYPDDKARFISIAVSGVLTFIIVSTTFAVRGISAKATESKTEANSPSPFSIVSKGLADSFSETFEKVSVPIKSGANLFLKMASEKTATPLATTSVESFPESIPAGDISEASASSTIAEGEQKSGKNTTEENLNF